MEENGRIYGSSFSNGDKMKGNYKWLDGTIYDGDFESEKMTGKGLIRWPSGSNYEGEFSGGFLHGNGTLTSSSGCTYRGGWRMNAQHGIGKKEYSNSDVYDGLWKEGVQEGCGKYSWNNGNTYIGNWKNGKIEGRGVMKWTNGDTFDGFWMNGVRHGSGVYRFADGSVYIGTWNNGLRDGKGTFYPAGTKLPSLKNLCTSLETEHFIASKSKPVKRSLSENIPVVSRLSSRPKSQRTLSLSTTTEWTLQDQSDLVYEREYAQGVLIMERIRDCSVSSVKNKSQNNKFSVNHVEKSSYMDIFKAHRGYFLNLNLQLGIRYTVGKITPVPAREVRSSDFGDRARIRMFFPRDGSKLTPPHCSIDFYWKDYCPMVFRNLREMFKLDAAEYMMSICGDSGLRDITSPGKSGSIFYLSNDERFVIKTLNKSELKVLLNMLPKYYRHVKDYENTLITKFFGLHRIKLRGGKKVRFVVMGNMFCTELHIHRRYDLKGSSQGRYTDKDKISGNTTLKDLDLKYKFHMDKKLRESLLNLLLGLHFRAPENLKALEQTHHGSMHRQKSLVPADEGEPLILPKGLLLVTHEPSVVNTAPGPHIRGNPLRAYSMGDNQVDLLLPGTARLRVQLGVNMPAQANRKVEEDHSSNNNNNNKKKKKKKVEGRDDDDEEEAELFEVYDVVLYMGIIDILQAYNLRKRVENAYKSIKFDPLTISVVQPNLYAQRFINFSQNKVFPQTPC